MKMTKIFISILVTIVTFVYLLSITKVVAPNQIFSEMTWGWGKAYIFYIISMHSVAFGMVTYFIPNAATFIGNVIKYYIPCRC